MIKLTVKVRNHIELIVAEWRRLAQCIESSSILRSGWFDA
jgi:hypothetical protein